MTRGFSLNARLALLLGLLVGGLGASACSAQQTSGAYGVEYRPGSVSYRTFETDHFDLIYQEGALDMARRTARSLERSWQGTNDVVGPVPSDLHMPVVINDYNDRSNGFVHPFPFRQEIEAPSIKEEALVARYSSWPALVAPHELVHAAHAEVQGGIGVGGLFGVFAPDIERALNLLAPRGLVEGVAVYRESRIEPEAGRLHSPLFTMKMKAATLSDDPWSLAQMLKAPSYTQPFNRFYIGGAHAFQYLAERGDSVSTDFFQTTVTWHNRVPVGAHGIWLALSTGQFPFQIGDEIQSTLRQRYQRELAARAPFTNTTLVAGERGLNHRRPYWLDEDTLIAYVHGYDVRPGFYRIDAATGERTPIRVQTLTEDRTYSLGTDTSSILAARYVQDLLVSTQARAEVERVDLSTGRATQLSDGGRALAPTDGPDGTVYAVANDGPFTRWVVVTKEGGTRPLTPEDSRSIRQIAPSPRDSTIAVLVHDDGTQRLYRARAPVETPVELTPWIGLEDAIIYDVSWGPEGRYLLFAADLRGTVNIFAYDTETKTVRRLANVQFGALEPALSPGRTTLAFVNYQHERHNLVRMPFRPDSATVVPDSLVLRGTWDAGDALPEAGERTVSASGLGEAQSYSSWRHLTPRMVYPTLHGEGDEEPLPYLEDPGTGPLGLGVGLGVQGTDPLQQWAYRGNVYWQDGRLWGEAGIQSGDYLLRPSLSVYDRAFTSCCADDRVVGAEERGASLGLSLPVTFRSNVYRTLLRMGLDAEVRQTRFFGGPLPQNPPFTTRVTLSPNVLLGYRLQQNPRDVVPNTGLVFGIDGEFDAWTERGAGSQYAVPGFDVYVPVLRSTNTGVRLGARGLVQNRGALLNTSTFVPRGSDIDVLRDGTFLQLEAEVTQPLWYIDDGSTLLPVYGKVLSVYGFGETLGRIDEGTWRHRASSVGTGLSLEARIFYRFNVDLRIGAAYRPGTNEVQAVYR